MTTFDVAVEELAAIVNETELAPAGITAVVGALDKVTEPGLLYVRFTVSAVGWIIGFPAPSCS
jgi:hypothetical protein